LENEVIFGFGVNERREFGDGRSKDRGLSLLIKFLIVSVDDFLGHGSCDWMIMVHEGLIVESLIVRAISM
jgi:hypothetical protein